MSLQVYVNAASTRRRRHQTDNVELVVQSSSPSSRLSSALVTHGTVRIPEERRRGHRNQGEWRGYVGSGHRWIQERRGGAVLPNGHLHVEGSTVCVVQFFLCCTGELDNSRIRQLADWTSRGLVNSRTRQLAH